MDMPISIRITEVTFIDLLNIFADGNSYDSKTLLSPRARQRSDYT
jgi:hypothetical protein